MTEVPNELTVSELDRLAEKLFQKRKEVDEASDALKKLQEEYTGLELSVIAHLESFNKDRYSLGDYGTISVVNKFSYKIPRTPESRTQFFDYLKNRGHYDSLISVNSQTLNAYLKDEMTAAVERGETDFQVPGISEPTLYQRLQLRKR